MFDSSLYDAGSALVEKYEGQLRLCNKYVAELCLAHSVGSSTVQAYVRSDRLELRALKSALLLSDEEFLVLMDLEK